jgi:hypothetical protein
MGCEALSITIIIVNRPNMSKLGETVEGILELLKTRGKISVSELEKEVPLADTKVLDFMNEWEFIAVKEGKVIIAKLGLALLNAE